MSQYGYDAGGALTLGTAALLSASMQTLSLNIEPPFSGMARMQVNSSASIMVLHDLSRARWRRATTSR